MAKRRKDKKRNNAIQSKLLSKKTDEAFFWENKIFTTDTARKQGICKSTLQKQIGIVNLGTFPTRQINGKRMETIWTYDPTLAQLIKRSYKADTDELLVIRDKIEEIMRVKLGVLGIDGGAIDSAGHSANLAPNIATDGNETIGG